MAAPMQYTSERQDAASELHVFPGADGRFRFNKPAFEGSGYVGLVARILEGLPLMDMAPNWQATRCRRGLLVPGELYIGYAEEGGAQMVFSDDVPHPYRVIDPRTGEIIAEGVRAPTEQWIPDAGDGPRVYVCCRWDQS